MPEWLILADDLSGANDTGAAFALRGLETIAATGPGPMPPADAWVVSTASRALVPEQANARVREVMGALRIDLTVKSRPRLYKKIDSALRGNPAEELLALLQSGGAQRCLLAPAFPQQGRTARAGRIFWKGAPLLETEFRGQTRTDDLFELFRPLEALAPLVPLRLETVRQGTAAIATEMRSSRGVWIADAESDADLDALARAACEAHIPVLCGSAGLAGALARATPQQDPERSLPRPGSGAAILAAGSRSRVAAVQVEEAVKAGARRLALPEAFLAQGDRRWLEELCGEARKAKTAALILSLEGLADDPAQGEMLAVRLGCAAAELARRIHPAGLVLTGGDTAAAVLAGLGARLIRLLGETEPGIPWGRLLDGELPGLAVVTKAGSFGGPDALARALRFLNP